MDDIKIVRNEAGAVYEDGGYSFVRVTYVCKRCGRKISTWKGSHCESVRYCPYC